MDAWMRPGTTWLAGLVLVTVAAGACSVSSSNVTRAADAPHLLTDGRGAVVSCMDTFQPGLLVADEDAGTTYLLDGSDAPLPVLWPNGYTARFDGSEVAVLDTRGVVVATTGHRYELSSANGFQPEKDGMWWGCPGYLTD